MGISKAIIVIVLFVIYVIFKLIIVGTKTAFKVGKEAYNTIDSRGTFESFKQGITEGTPHAIIGMLTKVAKSDGRINEYEAAVIQNLIDQMVDALKSSEMDYDTIKNYRDSLIKTYKTAKDDYYGITHYANKIDNIQDVDLMKSIISKLVMISFLEGLTLRKEIMIHEAAEELGVSRFFVEKLIDTMKTNREEETKTGYSYSESDNSMKSPYEILGVDKHANLDEIKKAYRKLVKKFHPDNIQSKGLDEEFMHFANQRMQEINTAYETIKAARV